MGATKIIVGNNSCFMQGRNRTFLAFFVAVFFVVVSGIAYRLVASNLQRVTGTTIKLPVPLSVFPMQVGKWKGKDVPIPQNIQRVARNDDFVSRLYIEEPVKNWANVYIAYSGNPRTMVGHNPEACYVGSGWIHDNTEQSEVVTNTGRKIPCLIHYFHTPLTKGESEQVVVLNFYILNGEVTCREEGFSGIAWRVPNIAGNPARYVAQVQISSVLESSAISAASDMTDLILRFLPDGNGEVGAVEYLNSAKGTVK
jgi:hypothetical protein